MAAIFMPVGNTALATDWLTVAAGAEHSITIIGASGAELTIEQRIGATSDGQPIGRLFVSSSRPEGAGARIQGPFSYRVVRREGVNAGAQIEPESSGGGSD